MLAGLASEQAVPAGGSASAAAVAMAAALLEKVAKLSEKHWAGAARAVERATAIRTNAELLIDADAVAYATFVEARRGAPGIDLEAARSQTIEVPSAIVRIATDATALASELEHKGNPNLRSDARVAAQLAGAGARAALITIAANLPTSSRDARLLAARRSVRLVNARLRSPGARGSAGDPGHARARSASSRRR